MILLPYTKQQYQNFPRKKKKTVLMQVRKMVEYRDAKAELDKLTAKGTDKQRIRLMANKLAELEKTLPKSSEWNESIQRLKK